jgi:hypothetical protein
MFFFILDFIEGDWMKICLKSLKKKSGNEDENIIEFDDNVQIIEKKEKSGKIIEKTDL